MGSDMSFAPYGTCGDEAYIIRKKNHKKICKIIDEWLTKHVGEEIDYRKTDILKKMLEDKFVFK